MLLTIGIRRSFHLLPTVLVLAALLAIGGEARADDRDTCLNGAGSKAFKACVAAAKQEWLDALMSPAAGSPYSYTKAACEAERQRNEYLDEADDLADQIADAEVLHRNIAVRGAYKRSRGETRRAKIVDVQGALGVHEGRGHEGAVLKDLTVGRGEHTATIGQIEGDAGIGDIAGAGHVDRDGVTGPGCCDVAAIDGIVVEPVQIVVVVLIGHRKDRNRHSRSVRRR